MKNMKKYMATFLAIVMLMGIFTVVPTVSAYDNPTVKISDETTDNNGNISKDDNQKDDNQKDDGQKDDNQDENNPPVPETTVSITTNTSETSATEPPNFYIVKIKLENMTCSNNEAKIAKGETYTNVLRALNGFTIKSVSVVMDNKEIQPKIENDICIINIQNVSYDISIVAIAEKITTTPTSAPTETTPTSAPIETTPTTSTTEPTTAIVPTTEPTTATVPTIEPTTATVPTTEPTVPGPICSVNSTNNCATSQTVTLTLNNTTKYYWGTKENPDENDFENVTTNVVEKKVSKEGTYYFVAKNEKKQLIFKNNTTFYKTTLNANGGKVNPSYIITESSKNVTLPKPTKKNYVFNGWILESNTKKKYSKVKVISNKTYKALWISPKITLKIQNKTVVKDGYKKFISYNKDGVVSDWYKYSVNCNKKAVWRPSNAKSRKVLTIKNDTKKGIVIFTLNKKAVSTQFYQVECLVSGKKVFSMQLYFSDLEKLYNVKITRNNKKTVSLSWKKTTNSQKYLVTVKDKNTKKTVYKTLSLKAKSYKYTKLNPRHKYSVSVRLCYTIHGITYYGNAKTKTV